MLDLEQLVLLRLPITGLETNIIACLPLALFLLKIRVLLRQFYLGLLERSKVLLESGLIPLITLEPLHRMIWQQRHPFVHVDPELKHKFLQTKAYSRIRFFRFRGEVGSAPVLLRAFLFMEGDWPEGLEYVTGKPH